MKLAIIKIAILYTSLFLVKNVIGQTKDTVKSDELKTVSFTPPVKFEPYELTKQEKGALNQFLAFCKIQIDVEDGSRFSTNYTMMIIQALKDDQQPLTKKSVIKSKLDEVNTNADLRYKFLTYFTSLIGEETSNLYFILRPVESDTRFVTRISTADADILSNMMLSHFYKPTIKEVDYTEEKNEEKESPQIYTVVDKESSYNGGTAEMYKFINKNLTIPIPSEPTAKDYGSSNVRIILSFIVNADGTLSNFEILVHKVDLIKFEEAVIECFKKMPKWNPAESNGSKVASRKTEKVVIFLKE